LLAKVLQNEFSDILVTQLQKYFPDVIGKYSFVAVLDGEIKEETLNQSYALACEIKKEGIIGRSEDNCFLLFSLGNHTNTVNLSQITQVFAGVLSEHLGENVSISKICTDYAMILRECREGWIGFQSLFYLDTAYCWGVNKYKAYEPFTVGALCDRTIAAIRSYSKDETVSSIENLHSYFETVQPTDIEYVKNTYSALLSTFVIYNNKEAKVIAEKLETVLSTIHSFTSFKALKFWVSSTIDNDADLINRNKFSAPVEEALRYVEKNYQVIGYVNEIAEQVNLSLDYFSRVFKKEMGITISSYLINYRLDKASVMLKSSNLSIKEIAQKVGIENVSYFSKSFKKKFHVQPIGFRIQSKN
jgi:YesN/AraC family two-component response regulator